MNEVWFTTDTTLSTTAATRHSKSYLHIVEDEKEGVGVELIEEFRRVQHRRWCKWVIWRCRAWIAGKICSAHNISLLI